MRLGSGSERRTPAEGNTRKLRAMVMRTSADGISFRVKSASRTRKLFCGSSMTRFSSEVLAAKAWRKATDPKW